MSPRAGYALAVLLAALVACEKASDEARSGGGEGGEAAGGSAGKGGASGLGGTSAGIGGSAAGSSARGGAGSGLGGQATGSAGTGSAGRSNGGGTAGSSAEAGSGGTSGGGGSAGSATLGGNGGRGGEAASAGSSELAGAGGEPGKPTSSCTNPYETVDLSEVVASEAFEPYVVTGDTANQIRQSINQNRSTDYDAYTGWYVSWQFGDCAGNDLVITVDVTYSYPEWEPSAGATTDLVTSWDTYMDALFCHEYGHAKHAFDCANDVYTALAAIDAGGDCGEQQAEAEAAFGTILDEYNQLDIQYDADTNHGETMGAVFPP